jgi:hypothetical protein
MMYDDIPIQKKNKKCVMVCDDGVCFFLTLLPPRRFFATLRSHRSALAELDEFFTVIS